MSANEQREQPFGLKPIRTGVTQPHVLQWVDPTFDEAEPLIEAWLRARETASQIPSVDP